MHRGATAWANCKLIGVYVVHVGPHPTGTHYQVELVSAELRHLVKAVGWGWVFFLSRLRRADSKLFALLLRTLATESNLTLLNRAGRRLPRRQAFSRPNWPRRPTAPGPFCSRHSGAWQSFALCLRC